MLLAAAVAAFGVWVVMVAPRRDRRRPLPPMPARRPIIIGVEGLIGAGKSTLLAAMARTLSARVAVIPEKVALWRALPNDDGTRAPRDGDATHNLLQRYYDDPAKYAVPFQAFALATRVAALDDTLKELQLLPPSMMPEVVLVERSPDGDACFATMLHNDGVVDAAWYSAYHYVKRLYARFVPPVDAFIDMNVGVDTAMARLQERARTEEVGVTDVYQRHLFTTLRKWLAAERRPVLTLLPAMWEALPTDTDMQHELARVVLQFAASVRQEQDGQGASLASMIDRYRLGGTT